MSSDPDKGDKVDKASNNVISATQRDCIIGTEDTPLIVNQLIFQAGNHGIRSALEIIHNLTSNGFQYLPIEHKMIAMYGMVKITNKNTT